MPRFEITSLADPRLADYAQIREPQLLRERGLFVAESREVVRLLLEQPQFPLRSVLVSEVAAVTMQNSLSQLPVSTPLYVAPRSVIEAVVGYNVHRGCLAIAEQGVPLRLDDILAGLPERALVPVLDTITNPDNVGGIFRNALGFGAAAVLLSEASVSPLYRKAVRVSVAATLKVPFVMLPLDVALPRLRAARFDVLALSPEPTLPALGDVASRCGARVAVVLGSEWHGVSAAVRREVTAFARIPMAPGIDSLNVATSAGIALYCLANRT